jgi:hypothetical protein
MMMEIRPTKTEKVFYGCDECGDDHAHVVQFGEWIIDDNVVCLCEKCLKAALEMIKNKNLEGE